MSLKQLIISEKYSMFWLIAFEGIKFTGMLLLKLSCYNFTDIA